MNQSNDDKSDAIGADDFFSATAGSQEDQQELTNQPNDPAKAEESKEDNGSNNIATTATATATTATATNGVNSEASSETPLEGQPEDPPLQEQQQEEESDDLTRPLKKAKTAENSANSRPVRACAKHSKALRAAAKKKSLPKAKLVSEGPPTEEMEGGWPKGWVKKEFERASGATKGSTDKYWFSPINGVKLRSMREVHRFLKALEETNGDENEAKKKLHSKKSYRSGRPNMSLRSVGNNIASNQQTTTTTSEVIAE